MGKFTMIILGIYILYYAGNIVYDLFLKKTNTVKTDDTEVFSIGDFAERDQPEITQVGIEDAEPLNVPNSFSPSDYAFEDEPQSFSQTEKEPDIEALRRKFEQEEFYGQLDGALESLSKITKPFPEPEIVQQDFLSRQEDKFRQMLNLAETNVQMVNVNGIKSYKSVLPSFN